MTPGCLSCHSFISSAPSESMRPFEVMASWFHLGRKKTREQEKGERIRRRLVHEREREERSTEGSVCLLVSHLQRASIESRSRKSWSLVTEEMSMGNWASKEKIGFGLMRAPLCVEMKLKDTTRSPPKKTSTHSNAHRDLPLPPPHPTEPWWKAKRGSSISADQTNTAAAFRAGRQGGCGAQRERTGGLTEEWQ